MDHHDPKFDEIGIRCLELPLEPGLFSPLVELLNLSLNASETHYSLDIGETGEVTVFGLDEGPLLSVKDMFDEVGDPVSPVMNAMNIPVAVIPGLNLNEMNRAQKLQEIGHRTTMLANGNSIVLEHLVNVMNFTLETFERNCIIAVDLEGNCTIVGLTDELLVVASPPPVDDDDFSDFLNANFTEYYDFEGLLNDPLLNDPLLNDNPNPPPVNNLPPPVNNLPPPVNNLPPPVNNLPPPVNHQERVENAEDLLALSRTSKRTSEAAILENTLDSIALTALMIYFTKDIPIVQELVPFKELKKCLIKKGSDMPKLTRKSVTPQLIERIVNVHRDLLISMGEPGSNVMCDNHGNLTIQGFQQLRLRARNWKEAKTNVIEASRALRLAKSELQAANENANPPANDNQ